MSVQTLFDGPERRWHAQSRDRKFGSGAGASLRLRDFTLCDWFYYGHVRRFFWIGPACKLNRRRPSVRANLGIASGTGEVPMKLRAWTWTAFRTTPNTIGA